MYLNFSEYFQIKAGHFSEYPRATRGGELTGEDCGEMAADTSCWPSRMKKSAEINQVSKPSK